MSSNLLKKKIKKDKKSPISKENIEKSTLIKQKNITIEFEEDDLPVEKDETKYNLKIKTEKNLNSPASPKGKLKKEKKRKEKGNISSPFLSSVRRYNSLSICFPDSIIALHQVNFFI